MPSMEPVGPNRPAETNDTCPGLHPRSSTRIHPQPRQAQSLFGVGVIQIRLQPQPPDFGIGVTQSIGRRTRYARRFMNTHPT